MSTPYQLAEPLKGALFVLYSIIKKHGILTVTQDQLAELTGYDPRTVCLSLGILRTIGLVSATRKHTKEPYTYEALKERK